MKLTCSKGDVEVNVGDRFRWHDGMEWEVIAFNELTYSPSGLGGTPTVRCRRVGGEMTDHMREFMEGDECDWCGDSVAAGLYWSRAALNEAKDG